MLGFKRLRQLSAGLLYRQKKLSSAPPSVALIKSGSHITLTGPDSSGLYTIISTAGIGSEEYVASSVALTGDLLCEVIVDTPANGAAYGFDASQAGSKVDMDECLRPDEGFGSNALNFYQNGTPLQFNMARNGRAYVERVGSTTKVRTGASESAALAASALYSHAAVQTGAAFFRFNPGAAGQWRARAYPHP